MPSQLNQNPDRGSTIKIVCVFTDENGTPVNPNSLTWSLYDEDQAIVNNRQNIAVAAPTSTTNIILSGNDLELNNNTVEGEKRHLVLSATYDSNIGSNLPLKQGVEFYVVNTHPRVANRI